MAGRPCKRIRDRGGRPHSASAIRACCFSPHHRDVVCRANFATHSHSRSRPAPSRVLIYADLYTYRNERGDAYASGWRTVGQTLTSDRRHWCWERVCVFVCRGPTMTTTSTSVKSVPGVEGGEECGVWCFWVTEPYFVCRTGFDTYAIRSEN